MYIRINIYYIHITHSYLCQSNTSCWPTWVWGHAISCFSSGTWMWMQTHLDVCDLHFWLLPQLHDFGCCLWINFLAVVSFMHVWYSCLLMYTLAFLCLLLWPLFTYGGFNPYCHMPWCHGPHVLMLFDFVSLLLLVLGSLSSPEKSWMLWHLFPDCHMLVPHFPTALSHSCISSLLNAPVSFLDCWML
jgi:hypothetical protein